MTPFGDLLRGYRKAAGLTPQELAERASLSVQGVQKVERGTSHPYRDTAQRLIAALALAPEDQARLGAAVLPVHRRGSNRRAASDSVAPHNLPLSLTSFIGREAERRDLVGLIAASRLVTLTGVGGCGKTRLGLEVAHNVASTYPGGVWLVELAPLGSPALLPGRVATVLGVRESADEQMTSSLVGALRTRRLLLVLDNCEHLLDACAQLLLELLRGCPDLYVLATSREPIGVPGEVVWRLHSLPLPGLRRQTTRRESVVRLFVERARAVLPGFALTPQNAAAVEEVCHRLDGIPLALELAAARVDALSIEQLAQRLHQRFRLLTGGARTADPRQQTLVATLDWSYGLLSQSERRMFEQLSAFDGAWTLEAAESICPGTDISRDDVLDLLAHLIRKSLVIAEEVTSGEQRYRLLETVREYAKHKLSNRSPAEQSGVRVRHVEFYSTFLERLNRPAVDGQVFVPDKAGDLFGLIDAEYDNVRSALVWWIESAQTPRAANLADALRYYWMARGMYAEARRWLEAILKYRDALTAESQAALLNSAGLFASRQSDYHQSLEYFEASGAIWRTLGNQLELAVCLSWIGLNHWLAGDDGQASALLERALGILEPLLAHHTDAVGPAAMTLRNLGLIARAQEDYERAAELFRRSVEFSRIDAHGDDYGVARGLCHLGRALSLQGDLGGALEYLSDGLQRTQTGRLAGHTLADCLDWVAAIASVQGHPLQAARLFGAADAQWRASGAVRYAPERPTYEREVAAARALVHPEAFTTAWTEGLSMSREQAIALAQGVASMPAIRVAGSRTPIPR